MCTNDVKNRMEGLLVLLLFFIGDLCTQLCIVNKSINVGFHISELRATRLCVNVSSIITSAQYFRRIQ